MDSINTSHPTIGRPRSHAPKPDRSNPAAEVGWFLRRERERYNCSLEDAALATRINRRYLAAIEDGDLDSLPDPEDGLRYVTTYAAFLGFEPAPLAQHYATVINRHRVGSPAERALRGAPTAKIIPFPRIPLGPRTVGLAAALVVAGGIFGGMGWMISGDGGDSTIPVVRVDDGATAADPITTASIPAASPAVRRQATTGDELTEEDTGVANAPLSGGADGLDGLTEFIQQNVTNTVPTEPPAKPKVSSDKQSRTYGIENAESRLVLQANAPVWVRIEDRQGNVILTKTMMAGDSYRVPNRSDLVVIARDGGALSYIVDGKKLGTLGAPGEILVGRSLDLATLEKSANS
ncbi:helix-turn-helix domain-containing protein [Rhodoligotrophos defluvii]|uniref:helix-turn-helix domain-containing protein n=1 Tax=Rhodoligotrophos defluvii TaxID=2561934 RepID=UPI0010C950E0|nr:helix-turn-helix domain-containing protein [Rhodoligotrophos defluvii]